MRLAPGSALVGILSLNKLRANNAFLRPHVARPGRPAHGAVCDRELAANLLVTDHAAHSTPSVRHKAWDF